MKQFSSISRFCPKEEKGSSPAPVLLAGTEEFKTLLSDELTGDEYPSPEEMPVPSFSPQDAKTRVEYCPVRLRKEIEGARHFEAYITGVIVNIEEYFNLLEVLATMKENDTLIIFISSPGGLVNSGAAISSLITECAGKVTTIATGICASAGSLIWSAGHECKVEPTAVLMWHMSSHYAYGNSLEIQTEAAQMVEHVKQIFLAVSVRKGHLTEEEMNTICSEPHREIYISAKEMQSRIDTKTREALQPTKSTEEEI